MSIELPGVNAMIRRTGFVGYVWEEASAPKSPSASSRKTLRKAITHLYVFGFELHSGRLGLLQKQGSKVLLRPSAPDHLLNQVARHRRERHRHFEAPARIQTEVHVLTQ